MAYISRRSLVFPINFIPIFSSLFPKVVFYKSLNLTKLKPLKIKGLRIEIKDPDNYPYVYKSVLAKSGMNVYELKKTTSFTEPQPYSKCDSMASNKNPLVDEMKRQGMEYDRANCLKFYFQNWTINNFNCYNLFYPRLLDDTSPPCTKRGLFNPLVVVDEDLYDEASKNCPLDCDLVEFQHAYSYKQFPTRQWYDDRQAYDRAYLERLFGKQLPDYETIRSCFVSVYIVFSTIAIEEITEKPRFEFADLLANVGGDMGLFVGPSLLTFTEIFEILFLFIEIKWLRNRAASVDLDHDHTQTTMDGTNDLVTLNSFRSIHQ